MDHGLRCDRGARRRCREEPMTETGHESMDARAPRRTRGTLLPLAVGTSAVGVCCGLPLLGSIGAAGVLAGLGAGSWIAAAIASFVTFLGVRRCRTLSRRSSPDARPPDRAFAITETVRRTGVDDELMLLHHPRPSIAVSVVRPGRTGRRGGTGSPASTRRDRRCLAALPDPGVSGRVLPRICNHRRRRGRHPGGLQSS